MTGARLRQLRMVAWTRLSQHWRTRLGGDPGRLVAGEANVNELAEPFQLSLPAISKHLKVLERAGLIVRGQRAQYRPCTLDAAPLREVSSWAEQYRPIWEARFDRMDTYLLQLQQQPETGNDDD